MIKPVVLYGPDNLPIKREALKREVAAPALAGIRTIWTNTVASGLTPDRLANLLTRAAEGDAQDYLVLAEEMEERELHYASVLGTRKRALSGLDPAVAAASDDARDVELADAVRDLVADPQYPEMVDDLLDALGKGYSAVETMWDTRGKLWRPERYEHRDPRWFTFDRESGRRLLLLDEQAPMGMPLPPFKFITHVPRLKSGLPIRGGLARLVAWSFMFKSYTVKDWMAFIEVFGMPLRLGKYGPAATEDDIDILARAVANIGTDAAAVMPESMKIEFQETTAGKSGHEVFKAMAEWLDEQVSKAVLGQTMTSDNGSSMAQAKVHNEVRHDILRSDARQLAMTINRDLVRPFIDLNFGPQERYPLLTIPVLEPEDITALVDALAKLVPLGLKVETSVIRDKLNLPDPEEGAELLGAPKAPPPAEPGTAAEVDPPAASGGNSADSRASPAAVNRTHRHDCPHCATARNSADADPDPVDEIEQAGLDGWEQQLAPVIDPVRALIQGASSYEEAIAGLKGLKMDSSQLVEALAKSMFLARAAGDQAD
ncbi:MAG: DUF935 domain-containing protein [Magnetospirillum sp.]|nr:DUF935 domain-containing protein [Magnetospirillum sp.]